MVSKSTGSRGAAKRVPPAAKGTTRPRFVKHEEMKPKRVPSERYTDRNRRPSPPFHAGDCKGLVMVGNNRLKWISKKHPTGGFYRWLPYHPKDAEKKPTGKKPTGKKVVPKKVMGKKVTGKKVTGKKVTGKKVTAKKVTGKK